MVFKSLKRSVYLLLIATLGSVLLLAALMFYYHNNPETTAMPVLQCPSKLAFGLNCAGCGSQRALHALLGGDFALAFRYNPVLFILAPLIALLSIQFVARHFFNKIIALPFITARFQLFLFFALIVYTILRNVPHHLFDCLNPDSI